MVQNPPANSYEIQIDAQTEVVISAVSWATHFQKVNVHSEPEFKPGIKDIAFTGTGEGQAMKTDQGDMVLRIEKGTPRVLTLTFLYNLNQPTAWWDFQPCLGVKSFYPQPRGRVAYVGPSLEIDVVGSNDNNQDNDYNDCVVFVAKYGDRFDENQGKEGSSIPVSEIIRRAPTS